MNRASLAGLALAVAASVPAQSNVVAGMDIELTEVRDFSARGRTGAHPTGRNGFSLTTDVCNAGTVDIPWFEAFRRQSAPYTSEDHPFYAFIVVREANGRLEQISDWSYVKHGFYSLNDPNCTGTCQSAGTRDFLGPNCSDVYSASLNANRYYLGPPEEIDPWLGTWTLFGSHFDVGEPASTPNGGRSLTNTQVNAFDGVHHRIEIDDADLNVAGARYFYGGQVKIEGELESLRQNNFRHREFIPTWNGVEWALSTISGSQTDTILTRWTGATITSASNGSDDGRFCVGVTVTGPVDGMWHYEYAVYNRDNSRGGASFRLPICPEARVENLWFRDIDGTPSNDWTATAGGGEIAFRMQGANVLEWNTMYNFAFDCDAGPAPGSAAIDQARLGAGLLSVDVPCDVPGALANVHIGDGCGVPVAPALFSNHVATIPNPNFELEVAAQPGAALFVFNSLLEQTVTLAPGCAQYLDPAFAATWGFGLADGTGRFAIPMGVPNNLAIEGLDVTWQVAELAVGGPVLGSFNISNGLRVRVGNSRTGCP